MRILQNIILLIITTQIATAQMSEIEEILEIGDKYELISELNDLLHDKVKDYDNLKGLNEYERNVLCIQIIEDQVNNGGFSQYFYNSSGSLTYEGIEALSDIKAINMLDLFKRAAQLFPNQPISKNTDLRRKQMLNISEEITNAWNQLDIEFYKYPDDLMTLTIEYVKSNKSHFE